ncbi:hypothetical protein ACLOJK_029835 [Asimina triloba]
MATSCVRFPREHSRRDGCASHAQATFRKNLKELVRDHLHTCIALSACGDAECSEFSAAEIPSSSDSLRQSRNDGGCWTSDEEGCSAYDQALRRSAAAALSRRQARILDRWAAKQARVMITTIEQQAREAELSALSMPNSVTATEASYRREASPTSSDSSVDLPNLRASSLVQLWREFESEGRREKQHHSKSLCSVHNSHLHPPGNLDNSSSFDGRSEVCESEISEMDWESDRTPRHQQNSPRDMDLRENERVRVADMVRKLSSGESAHGSLAPCADATADHEQLSPREPASPVQHVPSKRNDVGLPSIRNPPRIRGRQAIQDLLDRMKRERQTELARLVEHHPVTQFSNRSRIQVLLRFKILQRDMIAHEQPHPASTAIELDELHRGSSIIQLREKFNSRKQQDGSSNTPAASTSRSAFVVFRNDSMKSEISCMTAVSSNQNIEYLDATPREQEIAECHALQSVREVLHEEDEEEQEQEQEQENGSPIDDWKERIVLHSQQPSEVAHGNHETVSNATQTSAYAETEDPSEGASQSFSIPSANNSEWQETADSAECYRSWEEDILMDESDSDNQQEDIAENWVSNESHPPREGSSHQQYNYNEWLARISDNQDICNLLERRTVSTLLASDFRERMNRLILSHLERQGNYSITGDSIDEYEGRQFQIQEGHEISNANQSLYTSVQLPLPSRVIHPQQDQRTSSLTYQSSTNSIELELIYELRRDMEHIHQEVSELRKTIASCVEMQGKLQQPPMHEDSAAFIQSGKRKAHWR